MDRLCKAGGIVFSIFTIILALITLIMEKKGSIESFNVVSWMLVAMSLSLIFNNITEFKKEKREGHVSCVVLGGAVLLLHFTNVL